MCICAYTLKEAINRKRKGQVCQKQSKNDKTEGQNTALSLLIAKGKRIRYVSSNPRIVSNMIYESFPPHKHFHLACCEHWLYLPDLTWPLPFLHETQACPRACPRWGKREQSEGSPNPFHGGCPPSTACMISGIQITFPFKQPASKHSHNWWGALVQRQMFGVRCPLVPLSQQWWPVSFLMRKCSHSSPACVVLNKSKRSGIWSRCAVAYLTTEVIWVGFDTVPLEVVWFISERENKSLSFANTAQRAMQEALSRVQISTVNFFCHIWENDALES